MKESDGDTSGWRAGDGDEQSGSAFFFGAALAEDLRLPMLRGWWWSGVARWEVRQGEEGEYRVYRAHSYGEEQPPFKSGTEIGQTPSGGESIRVAPTPHQPTINHHQRSNPTHNFITFLHRFIAPTKPKMEEIGIDMKMEVSRLLPIHHRSVIIRRRQRRQR